MGPSKFVKGLVREIGPKPSGIALILDSFLTHNACSMRALGMEPKAQCKGRRCACTCWQSITTSVVPKDVAVIHIFAVNNRIFLIGIELLSSISVYMIILLIGSRFSLIGIFLIRAIIVWVYDYHCNLLSD